MRNWNKSWPKRRSSGICPDVRRPPLGGQPVSRRQPPGLPLRLGPGLRAACAGLLARIKNQEFQAFTSTHVLCEAAHHLMTLEAATQFGRRSKVVQRLKQLPANVQQLTRFRQAIDQVPQLGLQVLTVAPPLVSAGAAVSQQTGLLTNDALVVAVMQAHGLTHLASADADFDRVPGLTRYAPA